ncbi:MAG: diguanylate cyclase [Betaproteobacteria bacterium]|nr:MAG: diguanylate cyclase [Betaproteobacteria bacterium]
MNSENPLALDAATLLDVLHAGTGATLSVVDRQWRFRYVNSGFARALKMPAHEAIGRTVLECYGEETMKIITPLVERVFAGESVTYERKGRIHDDANAWISVTMTPWRSPSGEILGFITTTLRVHELRIATEKLIAATQRLASHVENSPLTVLELDDTFTVLRCSARASAMLGYEPEQLVGRAITQVLSDGAAGGELTAALHQLQSGVDARSQLETAFTKPDGDIAQLAWFLSALPASGEQSMTVMCLIEDVSAKRLAEQQLRYLATHDSLTGLANRSGLEQRAVALLHDTSNNQFHVSCLFIDLDGFKKVNDNHGHAAGDSVLIETARRLTALIQPGDIAARVGGDEFVLVLKDSVAFTRAAELRARIVESIRAPYSIKVNAAQISAAVGASVGVSYQSVQAVDVTELIKQADAAMYQVKYAGKDRRR